MPQEKAEAGRPTDSTDTAAATRRWVVLLGIASLALALRAIYITQISHAPFFTLRIGDARAYHEWALRIAAGDWLGQGIFYQAPLYPYFLAAVYTIFGDGAAIVRFVQAVVGAGSCVLLAAAGMALFGELGAIAGALLAIYPPAIFLDGLFDKSTLVSFFTAALLYLLSAAHVRFRGFLAGVVLGLLSLTRENALLLAVPILLWFAIADRRALADSAAGVRRPWLAAAFVAGCALVLLPVGARNYAVGGAFHLTTAQFGPNFYIGNHAGATGLYDPLVPGHGNAGDEQEDAVRLAQSASGRTLSADEVSAFWTARALDFIRTQPGDWLRQLARKLALTGNAVEIADTESQEVYAEWSSLLRVLAPFSFGVIFCLAAFGAIMTAPDWRRLWFLHAIALTYTGSIVLFYLFARYRFPLVPVLLLLAAGGVRAWRDSSSRRMRPWAVGALLVAAVVTYQPLENTRVDRIAHYVNIGNTLLGSPATWDQAAVFYDKALKESPRSPAAHFGMGSLLTRKERPKEALAHYQTAVEGWPDNADLRLTYALTLRDVGENQRALEELDAASRLRAADPTPHVAAGNLLLDLSRPDDAWQAYQRALAIQPKHVGALTGSAVALEQLLALNPTDQAVRTSLERVRAALNATPR